MRRIAVACITVAMALSAVPAIAAPRDDAEWTEYFFPSEDGLTMLHADVLRPKGLDENDKTPVMLTVSPYTNHSGQTTDFSPTGEGPSERFYDFLDLTDILKRGYTYVIVDLPGTGGSSGCNDWGGVREQEAAKAAVEWAASQPWSTGRVGMIGKSYDGWTGLMAMAQKPKGLAAVVSMEPVYSGYRYLYNNGVRFSNSVATPALFQAIDAKPGTTNDQPLYHAHGAPQVWCYGVNMGLQQQDDPNSAFWMERDLLPPTKGSRVPLFLTQGFMETNTKPDAAFDFFNALKGPNRAWFGQFDHYRGWERQNGDSGAYHMGRDVFVEEMMRFLDYHVKGVAKARTTVTKDPVIEVQDNFGRYRAEQQWPPSDAKLYWNKTKVGSYADEGTNSSTGSGNGIWTFSQPLPHDVWVSGEPVLKAELDVTVPRGNLVANVYDVSKSGSATVVSRGTTLLGGPGAQEVEFELYGQDWMLPKGHRIGIQISGANSDWWVHVPTRQTVSVTKAQIGLPFLTYKRTKFLDKEVTPTLRSWLSSEVARVSADVVKAGQASFKLPPPLASR